MCAGRFKISVARRQHSNSWRRRGPDGSGVLLTFLSLRPHREQIRGRPKLGGLHKITMECFFAPALVSYRRALNCWASVSSAHLRRCRSLTARAFSRYSSALFRKTSTLPMPQSPVPLPPSWEMAKPFAAPERWRISAAFEIPLCAALGGPGRRGRTGVLGCPYGPSFTGLASPSAQQSICRISQRRPSRRQTR
jgi:hypothetical protein